MQQLAMTRWYSRRRPPPPIFCRITSSAFSKFELGCWNCFESTFASIFSPLWRDSEKEKWRFRRCHFWHINLQPFVSQMIPGFNARNGRVRFTWELLRYWKTTLGKFCRDAFWRLSLLFQRNYSPRNWQFRVKWLISSGESSNYWNSMTIEK